MPKYRHGVTPNRLMEQSILLTYDCADEEAPDEEILEDVKTIFEETVEILRDALESASLSELTEFLMDRLGYDKLIL